MPNIGAFHPQIVHFVIALLFVGVALRLVSLTGWFKFSGPAAATLILIGTIAAVAAVQSGAEAHGVVERIPGAGAAVQAHEEWGQRTRDIFLAVAALELIGLAFAAFGSKRTKVVLMASALVGLGGLYAVCKRPARMAASSSTRTRAAPACAPAIRRTSAGCTSQASTSRRCRTARPAGVRKRRS